MFALVEINEALLGVLALLAGGLVALIKSLMNQHDKHISALIDGLTESLEQFRTFEEDERESHKEIVSTQLSIVEQLKKIEERITT